MIEPHACDYCGEVYDEASGEGYCGICPTCMDAQIDDEERALLASYSPEEE